MLTTNPHTSRSIYPAELSSIMSVERAQESRAWLSNWSQLNGEATPLWNLPGIAEQLKVAEVWVKDESVRSGLGSFKALGAPVALMRLILRLSDDQSMTPKQLITGGYQEQLQTVTVISATDGNHGRALAAAAQSVGCHCVIVLHANVSLEREQGIAAYGAKIVRIKGNYDESVEETARLAERNGWQVVSDTSYPGYEDVPRDVMQGYGTMAAELMEQTGDRPQQPGSFTHVVLQGGVGGLAAGFLSYLWEFYGKARPNFIIVEPEQADCLYQSALTGQAANATGSVDSVMAGLACGEASPLAWRFLRPAVDCFMTISDRDAITAMQLLATGCSEDVPIVAGESGAAGIAGLTVLRNTAELSEVVGLNTDSRVLLINTEGDTAPNVYEALVGESAQSVLNRQASSLR